MPETTRHQSAFAATWAGLVDRLTPRGPGATLGPDVRLDGQTTLVTGASRGLGLAIATDLARRGATVWMAMRSRVDEAPDDVRRAVPSAAVRALQVDLSEPASVEALADRIRDELPPLDVLVCNAGVVVQASRTTAAGLDTMVHVNFVANAQLLDRLVHDGAYADAGARVVVVGSEAHRSAEIDLDRWTEAATYGTGEVLAWYGRSKLLLHTWTVELSRRLDGQVAVHHLCPGAIASSIAREAPGWSKPVLDVLMRAAFQSPATAAKPAMYLAASPEIAGETGVYLHMDQRKQPAETARDPERGKALWDSVHDLIATWRHDLREA